VISSAVLGFLILFNAREMCSSRRRVEFGIFRIAGSSSRKMNLAYSSQGADVSMGLEEITSWNGRSWLSRRQQLNDQVSYDRGLVLSGAANQSVRALEALWSFHFHFPIVICARPDN